MLLCNIYTPNCDTPQFFQEIYGNIETYNIPIILARDFNLVLNPEQDTNDYVNNNNPKAREEVLNIMLECNLINCWRELNLENKQFTWRKKNTDKQARLDFFFISEGLFTDVDDSMILPGYKTPLLGHTQV